MGFLKDDIYLIHVAEVISEDARQQRARWPQDTYDDYPVYTQLKSSA